MWGTFGGDTMDDKTNPIRKYYVVPIVIAIVSIIVFSQIWIIMNLAKKLVIVNVVGVIVITIIILYP